MPYTTQLKDEPKLRRNTLGKVIRGKAFALRKKSERLDETKTKYYRKQHTSRSRTHNTSNAEDETKLQRTPSER
jgi:hypothetical protein